MLTAVEIFVHLDENEGDHDIEGLRGILVGHIEELQRLAYHIMCLLMVLGRGSCHHAHFPG